MSKIARGTDTLLASIGVGTTVHRTFEALVGGTTTNVVTVTAGTGGGETCQATASATVTRVVPPAACDGDSTVASIVLRYTGQGRSASTNPQDGKAICTGGANFAQPVRVLIRDDGDGTIVYGDESGLALGDPVAGSAAAGGETVFKANTLVRIFNAGGGIVEENEIHTSCSKPLAVGDQFGSLEVVELGLVPE